MAETKQHICRVSTARIDYRGQDGQLVLNTTIKSGSGLGTVFAPTWKMVMQSKQGEISWDEYQEQYIHSLDAPKVFSVPRGIEQQ